MNKIVITGGLGFIGVNTAIRFINKGLDVIIIDNMSRKGADLNYEFLKENFRDKFKIENIDVRNFNDLIRVFKENANIKAVYHFAAQVAVTTSVIDPREDFEINAIGTFNILECIRLYSPESIIVYSSTNKVYGGMEDKIIELRDDRYCYKDFPFGIDEGTCLDFHSPYGCSKGAADQYIRDYHRIYNIKSVVFRQSCIYGIRQFGIEDQGWVAWFTIAAMLNKQITVYGDGKQVRDVLFIDDLVDLYESVIDKIDQVNGDVFNIGGGHENVMSLLNLLSYLEEYLGKNITYKVSDWRPGDQKVYVSNINKLKNKIGWEPKIDIKSGIKILSDWVVDNKSIIEKAFS
jgi:CDP-paratose 2-epimerase